MELTSYEINSPQRLAQSMVMQAMLDNEHCSPLSSAILRDILAQGRITHAELDKITDEIKQFIQEKKAELAKDNKNV